MTSVSTTVSDLKDPSTDDVKSAVVKKPRKGKFGKCSLYFGKNDPDYDIVVANTSEIQNITTIILYHFYHRKCYVLVQKRSNLMTHPGEICGPGGKCDPNETWLQSIARETKEECGYDISSCEKGTLWVATHNLNDVKSHIHNIGFALEIPFNYKYSKPSYGNELDKKFFDTKQKGARNYHQWVLVDDLLNEKYGPLLKHFRKFLLEFIKHRRVMEQNISEHGIEYLQFRAKSPATVETKDDEKEMTKTVVNNKIQLLN
jgi:8-oxo-dGTP pyrophosphatase MutT (NUDIX family)